MNLNQHLAAVVAVLAFRGNQSSQHPTFLSTPKWSTTLPPCLFWCSGDTCFALVNFSSSVSTWWHIGKVRRNRSVWTCGVGSCVFLWVLGTELRSQGLSGKHLSRPEPSRWPLKALRLLLLLFVFWGRVSFRPPSLPAEGALNVCFSCLHLPSAEIEDWIECWNYRCVPIFHLLSSHSAPWAASLASLLLWAARLFLPLPLGVDVGIHELNIWIG